MPRRLLVAAWSCPYSDGPILCESRLCVLGQASEVKVRIGIANQNRTPVRESPNMVYPIAPPSRPKRMARRSPKRFTTGLTSVPPYRPATIPMRRWFSLIVGAYNFTDAALQEEIDAGHIPGPHMQVSGPNRVAGLYAWNQLGRNVMKGQKGIRILAPMM